MARTLSTTAHGPATTAVAVPALRSARTRAGSALDRASFDAFVAEVFEELPRADQRRWAHVYTRGLLVTPGRKTARRLAGTVSGSATAAQALHQFVNASPWGWQPVRARLTDWVVGRALPRALVIGTAVLPKRGDRSCGVHRRFVPQEGRTVNCQIGVAAFLATDAATVPVDWRLLLPGAWADDPELRSRARVPESAPSTRGPADRQVLDLVDGVTRTLSEPATGQLPVVADLVGFADTTALVGGLLARRRRFVVAVPDDLAVLPDRSAPGTQGARPDQGAVPARDVLAARPARAPLHPRATTVATGVVRLPGTPVALRLIGGQGADGSGDGRIWLTDLVDRPPREVRAAARLHLRAADTMEQLADSFGLRAFEGRSYPGWHHHMTLVSAAFAYGTLGSATARPGAPARSVHGPRSGRPPRGARVPVSPAGSARGSTGPARPSPTGAPETSSRASSPPTRPAAPPSRATTNPTRTESP
ncbi:transposase [Streptomyces sp. NBC_01012]|uniref:IS701 family transposase n=1 Tax=Streptomyces sp. NBC_01012 TaxID=2903717 RepID=UPI003867650C|nr:transposase [Streptomyces sp. NBC_01012]